MASVIEIQDRIYQSLSSFKGKKVNASSIAQVKDTVLQILNSYLAGGMIDDIPLIDVNHSEELAYLKEKYHALRLRLDLGDFQDYTESIDLTNQMSMISFKISGLESQLSGDPSRVEIFFKEHGTFAPYMWRDPKRK